MSLDLARMAEHWAEMAAEAETKREANEFWKRYREVMILMTGDKNLFRRKPKPTSKPSIALRRTIEKCPCGSGGIRWSRKYKQYIMKCGHDSSTEGKFENGLLIKKCLQCGIVSEPQRIDYIVQFSCKCGRTTGWHFSNAEARDEWNMLVKVVNNESKLDTQGSLF